MDTGIKKKIEVICGANTAQRFEHWGLTPNIGHAVTDFFVGESEN